MTNEHRMWVKTLRKIPTYRWTDSMNTLLTVIGVKEIIILKRIFENRMWKYGLIQPAQDMGTDGILSIG